jgi:CheY-like chemotaxis protein
MAERMFDNRFRHGKCHFELAGTSPATVEMSGARFEKVTLDEEIGPEIVLKLTDLTPFAHELKQKRFALRLKSGVVQTSIGPVLFLFWWIPPIANGKPFALYEQILNPTHTGILEMLRQVASQTHLHLLLIGPGQELLDVYEFQSTFGLDNLIWVAENACREYCGMDFIAAKEEYDRRYKLMELFRMSEPGTEEEIETESEESSADMPESYRFDRKDRALLTAASGLLKKAANAEILRPAELVSVAKLQHVLSLLPRATHDLEITVSVLGPRRKFDEIETWHYWDIGIEGTRISISSGGHFHQPSTGGDSFTTMNWTAVPEEPAELEDYRGTLWMVPDVQSFPEAVSVIEFASGAYRIEIIDPENALLQQDENTDEAKDESPCILLVEDEKSVRDIIVPILSSAGFDCREAATGQSAIDLLESGVRINLVLSNLLLPEVDGFTLLLHVKQTYPRIPFVFVTAIQDAAVRNEVMRNGADGFLQKPFEGEQLLAIVRRVLGNAYQPEKSGESSALPEERLPLSAALPQSDSPAPETEPMPPSESQPKYPKLSAEQSDRVLTDLKAWMERGLMNPILRPSFLGIDPHLFVYSQQEFGGNPLPEFCSISRNLLDCFTTALLSAPDLEFPTNLLVMRCRLGEDRKKLMLYLTAMLAVGEQMLPLELKEESEVWVGSNLRPLAEVKGIALGSIFWDRNGKHSFFIFDYPGKMVCDKVPGLGAPGGDGKPRWPECELLLDSVPATLREEARRALHFVQSTTEGSIQ